MTEPAGLPQVSVRLLQAQVPYSPTTGATSLSDARQLTMGRERLRPVTLSVVLMC